LEPVLIKPMFRQALERQDEYATVVTIALLLLLRNLAAALAGPNQYTPGSNLPTVLVGPLPISGARAAAFVCALGAITLFYVGLKKTWYGLALRAASQSRIGAQTAGVDILRLDQIAFGIGVALAGVAGALLAPVFLVYPTNGVVTTVKGFEIIVIGGLGSIPGALIAGVLLGVVESLGAAFISSPYQNVYGFLLVLLVLLIRPTGLFGERVRQA
jgi:branched-chain amino acid transport system permease protein